MMPGGFWENTQTDDSDIYIVKCIHRFKNHFETHPISHFIYIFINNISFIFNASQSAFVVYNYNLKKIVHPKMKFLYNHPHVTLNLFDFL